MMRIALAVGFLLAVMSGKKKEAKPAAGVILLGDSNAVGLAPALRGAAQKRGLDVHVDATGGSGIDYHRSGSFAWDGPRVARARAGRQDWPLVLSLGGNDAWMDQTDPEVQGKVQEIVDAAGKELWWLSLPLPGIGQWPAVAELWQSKSPNVIALGEHPTWFQSDRIHLTAAGYRELADLVLRAIF
jgi:hypothetical protein